MFLPLLIGIIVGAYFYVRQRFQYFANRGIPYEPGYFPLGSIETWRLFTGRTSLFKVADRIAARHPTKEIIGYVGKRVDCGILLKVLTKPTIFSVTMAFLDAQFWSSEILN